MKVRIDVPAQDFRPGETVRGSVSVADADEVRGLRARLALRETSDGYSATAWTTGWEELAGPGRAPPEVGFALELPPAAVPNPLGTNGPVRWEVEVVADRSRRFDARASAPVGVVTNGSARSPQRDERIEGRSTPRQTRAKAVRAGKLAAIAALVTVALGIPLIALGLLIVGETIYSQDPGEGWALVLVGGICVAVAPLIWLVAVRRVQAPRSRGLRLAVEPDRSRRGASVRADLSTSEPLVLKSRPRVALELLELSDQDKRVGGSDTRVTVESVRWSEELQVDSSNAVAEIDVPRNQPFSYAGSCRSYLWRIVARETQASSGRRAAAEIEQMIWVDP